MTKLPQEEWSDFACPTGPDTRQDNWFDIEDAPKDGSEVWLQLDTKIRAFWCDDLKRWVLSSPWHMESYHSPKKFKPMRKMEAHKT